jgi:hypothetical protein
MAREHFLGHEQYSILKASLARRKENYGGFASDLCSPVRNLIRLYQCGKTGCLNSLFTGTGSKFLFQYYPY